MARLIEAALPFAAVAAIASAQPASAEAPTRAKHVQECVDLYSGAVDNLNNKTGAEGADGQPDGLAGSAEYDFNVQGSKVRSIDIGVDPQNLTGDFGCDDVAIERTVLGTVTDHQGKRFRILARASFTLDAKGTAQDRTVRPRRQPSRRGSNFGSFFVTASAEGYQSSSTIKTSATRNFGK